MSGVDVMPRDCRTTGEQRFPGAELRFPARKIIKKNMALLAVKAMAERLWPVKTAHWLASFTGTTPRGARLTLSERTTPGGDALALLIRSDAGLEFLAELMRPEFGPPPKWWADVQYGARLVDLERRSAANRDALADLRRKIGGDETT